MTFVVLFLLAVVWAVYLASWIRSRSEHRSVNSITSFNKHLSVLERTCPGRQGQPAAARLGTSPTPIGYGPVGLGARRASTMTRSEARRRRRDVLFILGGAALVTLMLAVVVGGPLVWLHLAVDVVLVAYLGLLAHTQRLAVERRNKVRYLPQVGGMPDLVGGMPDLEPSYLVPQSASANY